VLSIVGPLNDDLGPSIYRIKEIKSEIKANYELAKPIIMKRFQYKKGLEEVEALAPTLSDEIAGGASLEELEREYNVKVQKLDLYAGAELPDTFRNSKFEAMTAAAIDSASDLEMLPNQSMISIRLDSESLATLRPFSEVKDNIRKTLENRNTLDALYDKAVLIKDKYTSAKSLKEFAAEGEVEILIDQKLSRYGNDVTLPEKLLAQIFSMKLNQVKIQRFNESEVGYVTISFLEKVIVPNRSETVKLLKTVSKKYDQEILNEVLFNFVKSIETEFKIAVNQRSIDSALASLK
jgi:peptidyl-prolyl cis-trans isomerase D